MAYSEEGAAANNNNPVEIIDLTGDDVDEDDEVVCVGVTKPLNLKKAGKKNDAPARGRVAASAVVLKSTIKSEMSKSSTIKAEEKMAVAALPATKKMDSSSTAATTNTTTNTATVATAATTTKTMGAAAAASSSAAATGLSSKPAATNTSSTNKTLSVGPPLSNKVNAVASKLPSKKNDEQTTVTARKESSNNAPPPASKPVAAAAASKLSISSALKDPLNPSPTTAADSSKGPPALPAASTNPITKKQPPIMPHPSAKQSTTEASVAAASTTTTEKTKRPLTVAKKTTTTKRTLSVAKKSTTKVSSTSKTASKRPLENSKTLVATGKVVPLGTGTASDPRGATGKSAEALLPVRADAAPPPPSIKSVAADDSVAVKDSMATDKLPISSAPEHQHGRVSSVSNKGPSSASSVSTNSAGEHPPPQSLFKTSVSGTRAQLGKQGVAPETNESESTDSIASDTTAPKNKSTEFVFNEQPIQAPGQRRRVAMKTTKLKDPVRRLVSSDDSRPHSSNSSTVSGNNDADNDCEAASTITNANAHMGQNNGSFTVAGPQSTFYPIPAPTAAAENPSKSCTSEHVPNRKRPRGCLCLVDDDSDSSDDSEADSKPAAKTLKTGKDAPKVSSTALGTPSESTRNTNLRTEIVKPSDCAATQNIVSSATSSPREDDPDDEEYTDDCSGAATRARKSNERNHPSPALSVESDSKRVRLNGGNQENNQSPSSQVALKDYDSKTWSDGNGISKERAASFPRVFKRCGSCRACATERCGICGLCCFGPAGACVLRCCANNDAATKQEYLDEIGRMLAGRKKRGLVVGSRVLARRSADNTVSDL